MAFKKFYEIRNDILGYMTNNLSKIEGSYNFDIASAVAQELGKQNEDLDDFVKELFPWTVTKEPYLTYHLMSYGLTRLGETKAVGEITIKGKVATLIQAGSIVVSRVGVRYSLNDNVVISTNGIAKAKVTAIQGGEIGNCAIGDITNFELTIQGVTSVTNEQAITGGAPIETVESARERMKIKASVPSHSGNKNQYREWVREVGGIGNVDVFGPEDTEAGVSPGQVHIYFSTFQGEVPNTEQIKQVEEYLNTNNRRPVGSDLKVKGYEKLQTNITIYEVTVKKGSITQEKWKQEFKERVQLGYATKGFLVAKTVPFAKVSSIALEIEGTVLYDDLKINGTTSNISIAFNQTPVMGDVTITQFKEVD